MRIRFRKGVALFGTIAGAAVATILIAYNANQGNFVNVSDMEEAGLIDFGSALESGQTTTSDQPAVVGDSSGVAAVAAGTLGSDLEEKTDAAAEPAEVKTDGNDTAEKDAALGADADVDGDADTVSSGDVVAVYGGGVSEEFEEAYQEGVQTYVEVVPQTRTETVVSERRVTVSTPVTVTEQVSVDTEVIGDFHARSDLAADAELNTGRRAEEAAAIQETINKNLEAAEDARGELDYITGDMKKGNDDGLIIFY
jgi:hypothetical protein